MGYHSLLNGTTLDKRWYSHANHLAAVI